MDIEFENVEAVCILVRKITYVFFSTSSFIGCAGTLYLGQFLEVWTGEHDMYSQVHSLREIMEGIQNFVEGSEIG